MKRILVTGDAIIDRHWYSTPKGVSPEAPILCWDTEKIIDKPGGAANVVNVLSTLTKIYDESIEITFACIGSAELYQCLPEEFPWKGICISDKRTTIKNRILFKTPHQQIIRFDQDNEEGLSKEEEQDIISVINSNNYEIGLVSDYSHGGITKNILEAARARCNLVVCDPKGNDPYKYRDLVDAITPNSLEAGYLVEKLRSETNESDWNLLSYAICSNDHKDSSLCPRIILKMGEFGCMLYQFNCRHIQKFKPYRTDRVVIDPTGAGDTFIATLVLSLAVDHDWIQAVRRANLMAGLSVTYPNCWIPKESECPKKLFERKY